MLSLQALWSFKKKCVFFQNLLVIRAFGDLVIDWGFRQGKLCCEWSRRRQLLVNRPCHRRGNARH